MDTIFMNTSNSKTNEPHKLKLTLTNKLNLKRTPKHISLSNLSIYYTWKNIKKQYKNNKFKINAPTWNEEFELPDGSYSVEDINSYFQFIIKKHEPNSTKSNLENPILIYVNKIENRVTFKIKTGYSLEMLTPETKKLLGSSISKVDRDKNGENVPKLEIVDVVLVHCNLVDNDYQRESKVLYTFTPNKAFGSHLNIEPPKFIHLKTYKSEFQEIDVWFTDQNFKPLEIEDNINLTLIIFDV